MNDEPTNLETNRKNSKKSVKVWIILIAAPFILLTLTALTQVFVKFAINSSSQNYTCYEGLSTSSPPTNGDLEINSQDCDPTPAGLKIVNSTINIASWLVGIAAVFLIFLMPVWITMLVIAVNYNNKLE